MRIKALYITILGGILFGEIVHAQSYKIDAIQITAIGLQGEEEFGSYDTFISNTRNPALFRYDFAGQTDRIGIIRNNGFAIDFVFVQDDEPSNEFILGIQSGVTETEVFKEVSLQNDTNLVTSNINNSSQYFKMKAGYQRIFRLDKRIRIIAGSSLQLGIPISSKTTQIVETEFFEEDYRFFAKQSASVGFSLNYGIRFTLFRNVHAALISRPTFFFQKIDGTPTSTLLRGTNLSIQFKIRPK